MRMPTQHRCTVHIFGTRGMLGIDELNSLLDTISACEAYNSISINKPIFITNVLHE